MFQNRPVQNAFSNDAVPRFYDVKRALYIYQVYWLILFSHVFDANAITIHEIMQEMTKIPSSYFYLNTGKGSKTLKEKTFCNHLLFSAIYLLKASSKTV